MSDESPRPRYVPTERELALFRAMEDIHELTDALTVLLVDAYGSTVAVSGDENDIPRPLRSALGGRRLAAAGSVREFLGSISDLETTLNVSIYDVDGEHVLAIIFDAEADLMTVQAVGREGSQALAEILAAPL